MFERFGTSTRAAVLQAQDEARELGHPYIGTEHLLLALLRNPTGLATTSLGMYGLDHAAVRDSVERIVGIAQDQLDAEALASIGIDLDAVRSTVESAFGPGVLDGTGPSARRGGRLPFSARAKKTMELSLREALRLKDKQITDGHLLLGILREGEGVAAKIIAGAGIDFGELRDHVETELYSNDLG